MTDLAREAGGVETRNIDDAAPTASRLTAEGSLISGS
jgi:hypothetical protein